MEILKDYKPRDYQIDFYKAMNSGVKRAVLCWARRAGKDMTCFIYAIRKMAVSPINVFLIFPEKEQGRSAFWENIDGNGMRTIDYIPKQFIKKIDNTNMRISFHNGSTFQLLGSKNPDSLRGANGKLYIFSEFVDINSEVYNLIRPIVANNGGQIIIQSTPKIDGISGQLFRKMYEASDKDPDEYASRVTADKYMSHEELEKVRKEAIENYGNDFIFRQEYLVDWGSASNGSYYGDIIEKMKNDGRIGFYSYDPNYPVFTAWDWGMSDNTAIVFFQYYKDPDDKTGEKSIIRIIDTFEINSVSLNSIISFLQTKPYNYGWHFFPHDMAQRESDTYTRIAKVQAQGLINSSVLRREEIASGIERAIENMSSVRIHKPNANQFLSKIVLYKRKFNAKTGEFIGPEHDSASHFADAFRYVFAAIEQSFNKENCELLFSQFGGANSSYSPANIHNAEYSYDDIISPNYQFYQ